MRPRRMPRHQRLLPRRQLRIGVFDELIDLRLQALDFIIDRDRLSLRTKLPEILDLAFELGDRFFKFEKDVHTRGLAKARARWPAPPSKSNRERFQLLTRSSCGFAARQRMCGFDRAAQALLRHMGI